MKCANRYLWTNWLPTGYKPDFLSGVEWGEWGVGSGGSGGSGGGGMNNNSALTYVLDTKIHALLNF